MARAERSSGASAGVGLVQRSIALVALLLSFPLILAAAVVVRLSSRGPVLYRATRVGLDGTLFTMYKLRTMRTGSAHGGSITGSNDRRIVPLGRVLRRLKLDELPQLVNVVRGDMAFVGPRPEAPDIVRDHYVPWMRETLTVPPGVIGPGSLGYFLDESQMPAEPEAARHFYVENLLPRKLACELVFVRRRSLRYQLEIVVRAILGILNVESLARSRQQDEYAQADRILLESIPTIDDPP